MLQGEDVCMWQAKGARLAGRGQRRGPPGPVHTRHELHHPCHHYYAEHVGHGGDDSERRDLVGLAPGGNRKTDVQKARGQRRGGWQRLRQLSHKSLAASWTLATGTMAEPRLIDHRLAPVRHLCLSTAKNSGVRCCFHAGSTMGPAIDRLKRESTRTKAGRRLLLYTHGKAWTVAWTAARSRLPTAATGVLRIGKRVWNVFGRWSLDMAMPQEGHNGHGC